MGYSNVPIIQGTEVTFSCCPGFTLMGPNSSTCQDSGQWEPDPKEVLCTGLLMIDKTILAYTMSCLHHKI